MSRLSLQLLGLVLGTVALLPTVVYGAEIPPSGSATGRESVRHLSEQRGSNKVLKVGPTRQIRRISAAASMAQEGDIIEIDSSDYVSDVAVWKQRLLTIRGVGGRPRLIAKGAAAEGKAIWVIRGGEITVENIEFVGARVPDKNGAGIRFEQGLLVIKNCRFTENENGVLSSQGKNMRLEIENCEFGYNGAGDGYSHNLYVGSIQSLSVTGSYFHHARAGHLLKSRSAENHILYNRLTDERGGRSSYEMDFPNGGKIYVIGNLIEQSPTTTNSNIIACGTEGYRDSSSELYLINNTIVDNRPAGGNPLLLANGLKKLVAINNLLICRHRLNTVAEGVIQNNFNTESGQFIKPADYDYRLKPTSSLTDKYVQPPSNHDFELAPKREYVHPASTRPLSRTPRSPGAIQTPG
ncbi:MAG: right-handed parallel beta-helix repeat-containing protein [Desulfobacteraceae bacterium]|nr:MAG: right-handed parallel beta-helix repeat-containing protein [Desulfobacteraceae bacterium]